MSSALEVVALGSFARTAASSSKAIGCKGLLTGSTRATARPRRVITTSSPASTRSRTSLRRAFADRLTGGALQQTAELVAVEEVVTAPPLL